MMMTTTDNNNTAMFTADDRTTLGAMGDHLSRTMGRPVTVETCADDGPEWAALIAVERRTGSRGPLPTVDRRQTFGDAHEGPVLSAQVTTEPGRRLVILSGDGRTVRAAGDDLAALVRTLTH